MSVLGISDRSIRLRGYRWLVCSGASLVCSTSSGSVTSNASVSNQALSECDPDTETESPDHVDCGNMEFVTLRPEEAGNYTSRCEPDSKVDTDCKTTLMLPEVIKAVFSNRS